MEINKSKAIVEHYDRKVEEVINDGREIPSIKYGGRRTRWHLSDLTNLCLMQPYLHRTLENPPTHSADSCWKFLGGRNWERAIAAELPPKEVDGIIGTVDDRVGRKLVEIKATRESPHKWHPEDAHPDWIERLKGYCHLYDRQEMYLFVIFYTGNLMSYAPWMMKKNGHPGGYCGFERKGYRVRFDVKELEGFWAEIIERRDILDDCIAHKIPPPDELLENVPKWMCQTKHYDCIYSADCPKFLNDSIGI